MFRFSTHPASITITGGIGDAYNFLRASWQKWLPAVLILAALQTVAYLVLAPDISTIYRFDSYTGRTVWSPDAAAKLVPYLSAGIIAGILQMVVGWIFVATAIGGLRNRPMTPSQILIRGLTALWTGFLLALAMTPVLVVAVVMLLAAPPLGILLLLVGVVVGIYVFIRLIFYSLAIFDGLGPIEGLRESWRLSRNSVLRLFGWGLMAGLLSLLVSVAVGLVSAPFSQSHAQAVGQAIGYLFASILSCYMVFLMAVLYESQRARFDPTLFPYPPTPYYPAPFGGWPYPAGPYAAGPYVAGPYPAGPYPAGPYPVGPWAPQPYAPGQGWPPNPVPGPTDATDAPDAPPDAPPADPPADAPSTHTTSDTPPTDPPASS